MKKDEGKPSKINNAT